MKQQFANIISTIGHPLLTIPTYVLFAAFNYENLKNALVISFLIIIGLIVPIAIKMYKGAKKKNYTNFDISEQNQRQGWYKTVLVLMFFVNILLFFTEQSMVVKLNVLFATLLITTATILNYKTKNSLHVSLNIFLAFLILPLNMFLGIISLFFVFFISWSRLFLKRHTLKEIFHGTIIGFVFGILSLTVTTGYAQQIFKDKNYVYLRPKQYNDSIAIDSLTKINQEKILSLTQKILSNEFPNIHSLLIVKDNKLVYENYFGGTDEIRGKKIGYVEHNSNSLHDCRSISKSITATCIGIALKQKLIKSINEPIVQFFPEYKQYFDSFKRKITIKHLLTMTAGFEWNENISYRNLKNSELQMDISSDPIKYVLSRPIISRIGMKWNYNGGESELLGIIIKKVSGLPLDKFAEKHLFLPLGISNYQWLLLKENIPAAASGLRLRPRDLLKIGLLYNNDGKWNNNQIIEKDWATISLSSVVEREKNRGYGFQFWTSTDSIINKEYHISEARGNGGQRIFICKELNLIVVITAGNYNKWDIENDSKKALTDFIIPSFLE